MDIPLLSIFSLSSVVNGQAAAFEVFTLLILSCSKGAPFYPHIFGIMLANFLILYLLKELSFIWGYLLTQNFYI